MPSTAMSSAPSPHSLVVLPGVYQPQADTRLLAEALALEDLGARPDLLEIGTGTGALALHAAHRGARVTAVDVSWSAVATARLNARKLRLPLNVLHGDFEACTAGRSYDFVVSNPPYVPAPGSRLPSHGPERAWDAGPDGRAVIDRICAAAPDLLRSGGILLSWSTRHCPAPGRPSTG